MKKWEGDGSGIPRLAGLPIVVPGVSQARVQAPGRDLRVQRGLMAQQKVSFT